MIYLTGRKMNVRTLRTLKDGEGLTLKNGKIVSYSTGWQLSIADKYMDTTPEMAMKHVRELSKVYKNVGVWKYNGIFYIDVSFRVDTKKEAVRMGKNLNQISIYNWKYNRLTFLAEA